MSKKTKKKNTSENVKKKKKTYQKMSRKGHCVKVPHAIGT